MPVGGRGEEGEGKPIIVVQGDTRTTIDRGESVIRSGRTRSVETVDRMSELRGDNVEADAILALAGD